MQLNGTVTTFSIIYENVVYNYAENTLTDDYSYSISGGGQGFQVSAPAYPVNASLKSEISKMANSISVSGTCYDTTLYLPHPDSMFAINTTIQLSVINDSTIITNKDFLNNDTLYYDTLHYYSNNSGANTIVFRSYCRALSDGGYTSLTYNFVNGTYKFEQNYLELATHDYLSLQ